MTGPNIRISAEVTRQIRRHARASMTTEVCGVLIGDLLAPGSNEVAIAASIAAVNATQAGTHVTFTQDAWEHIYNVKDADFPNARIVGWYHSHPGFGVFLSEHDIFIQQNFFAAETQVAWVFDPHTDEEGCFGWAEGAITRLTSITVVDEDAPAAVSESRELTDLADERHEDGIAGAVSQTRVRSPWLLRSAVAAAVLLAALAGFAVSHLLFPSFYPLALPINPLSGEPLLRDPKTGEPVYMDLQAKRYLRVDGRTGRLVEIDRHALEASVPAAPPPAAASPKPADKPAEKPLDKPKEKP